MPEGPSLILVKEALDQFRGKKVLEASGHAGIDMELFAGKKLLGIETFGKHLLLLFPKFTISIHFLLFGWYSIDKKNRVAKAIKLKLEFADHKLYFYTCKVELFEKSFDKQYDLSADIMNDKWSNAKAVKKMNALPKTFICDALMSQDIFAGVGNIIKNEVLYNTKTHPESIIEKIPKAKLLAIAKESRRYSFDFLKWRIDDELTKHWLAYNRKICSRCNIPIIKKETGKTKRSSFFCENCQILY
ncbi:MAG: endonuclease [Ferruginibacter sp.]